MASYFGATVLMVLVIHSVKNDCDATSNGLDTWFTDDATDPWFSDEVAESYGRYAAKLLLSTLQVKHAMTLDEKDTAGHKHGVIRINQGNLTGFEDAQFSVLRSEVHDGVHDAEISILFPTLNGVTTLEGRIKDIVLSPPVIVNMFQANSTFDISFRALKGVLVVLSAKYTGGATPLVSSDDWRYSTINVVTNDVDLAFLDNLQHSVPAQMKDALNNMHILDLGMFYLQRRSELLDSIMYDYESLVEEFTKSVNMLTRDEL
ncbi:uncharacterized protein LOC135383684 [Ornithodoros turicata]|uniref:uncharacterized protein LOC135383684 n=1 Tax=Ornithodoros turicata TaxID=34597 RepID=UPI00313918EF